MSDAGGKGGARGEGSAGEGGAGGAGEESEGDRDYFRAIEAAFVRLRGAPLLLSPKDWQLASGWRREGIPLDLVTEALRTVFERRDARGGGRRVNSLAYCAGAVDRAWRRASELRATGVRIEPVAVDVARRLAALAAAVRLRLEAGEELAAAIEGLSGAVDEVEARLAELDREMLSAAQAGLEDGARRELSAEVERRLEQLADRLPETELADLARRLERRALRSRLELPLLSLFSGDAGA